MTQQEETRPAKVIKRYANRKLYDTERSCYVTLEEIAEMIKLGEDVRVVDNKSKDDLTAVTLAQIIVEEEKKVQRMPLKLLRSIIQSGNDVVSGFYEKQIAAAQHLRDDVERRVEGLWKRGRDKDAGTSAADPAPGAEAATTATPAEAATAEDAVKNGVIQEFVSGTTEAFEAWQKRIDERVKEALGKMPSFQPRHSGPDVASLKQQVAQLEARLQELENKRKGAS
jgi:polyhydroxyalkanoate synthesis repressor PhaR